MANFKTKDRMVKILYNINSIITVRRLTAINYKILSNESFCNPNKRMEDGN